MKLSARNQIKGKIVEVHKGQTTAHRPDRHRSVFKGPISSKPGWVKQSAENHQE